MRARRRLYARDVIYYTEGDCWLLAWWLAKLSDGELQVVTNGSRTTWSHVAAIARGGRHVLDVNGWQPAKEWAETWYADAGWRQSRVHVKTFAEYKTALNFGQRASSSWDLSHEQVRAAALCLLELERPGSTVTRKVKTTRRTTTWSLRHSWRPRTVRGRSSASRWRVTCCGSQRTRECRTCTGPQTRRCFGHR